MFACKVDALVNVVVTAVFKEVTTSGERVNPAIWSFICWIFPTWSCTMSEGDIDMPSRRDTQNTAIRPIKSHHNDIYLEYLNF